MHARYFKYFTNPNTTQAKNTWTITFVFVIIKTLQRMRSTKTIHLPQGPKVKLLAQRKESVRKDTERAFGVLEAWFTIIRGPAQHLEKTDLGLIIKACIVLHNIIVEDERDLYDLAYDYEHVDSTTLKLKVRCHHYPFYSAYLRRVLQV